MLHPGALMDPDNTRRFCRIDGVRLDRGADTFAADDHFVLVAEHVFDTLQFSPHRVRVLRIGKVGEGLVAEYALGGKRQDDGAELSSRHGSFSLDEPGAARELLRAALGSAIGRSGISLRVRKCCRHPNRIRSWSL